MVESQRAKRKEQSRCERVDEEDLEREEELLVEG